jgi:hypothetical protein
LEFLCRPMRLDALRASFFAAGNQCPSQPCAPMSAHSDHLFFQRVRLAESSFERLGNGIFYLERA